MSTNPIPDGLRNTVARGLEPVRPLPPAWQRALGVAVIATAIVSIALATRSLRFDIDQIPAWLSWGSSLAELAVGIFMVGLALREAVPGGGIPTGAGYTAIGAALLLQILVGVATWTQSPGAPLGGDWLAQGFGCLSDDALLIIPTFAATLWLVFRAFPVRAPIAGVIGGCGAAMTGDAIIHLLCPVSDLGHVLVWHSGAIVGFAALGWAIGMIWLLVRGR